MELFHKTKRIIFIISLILEMGAFGAFPVLAGSGGSSAPSPDQVAAALEKRYHVNLGSAQNQGESFNVSSTKQLAPEVSLFFSPSDPKQGEKLSAKAFAAYFSNEESTLYYTWYLKHKGCDLKKNVKDEKTLDLCNASDPNRGTSKRENPGDITVEDWKIEAARIIAQNGYTPQASSAPLDDDGYKARFGGDNKANTPDHCYVHDASSGMNYELAGGSSVSFECPSGTSPVCMEEDADNSSICYVTTLPSCSNDTPTCVTGNPRCVADPETTTSCGTALTSCSSQSSSSASPYCRHLFPNAKGRTSGDGSFGEQEEEFWGTDPRDPDTADNGNKDEANVVGLGNSTFTWNYVAGDKVGVAVEGTSLVTTKHDDSSYMIMWAFSKKDCPISLAEGTGSYTKSIKGYDVVIPTANFDLNKCLEKNLVDPTQGGQATNLDIAVSATPNNPINDESGDKEGDLVAVQASVSNAQRNLTDMVFDWKIEASNNIQFTNATDITQKLREAGLIRNTKGNALDNIKLKLDFPANAVDPYVDAKTRTGYLRFKVTVTENFSEGVVRKGRSDVIVKFNSSGQKISAYAAVPKLSGDAMKVSTSSIKICDENALEHASCRVVKSEVVGLKVDPTGLSNFHWTVNGDPLTCSARVSDECNDTEQKEINFLPIAGNVSDLYTVTMTANDVTTGNTLTLTRSFHVVEPIVLIESLDKNVVWPKFLGQYKDITGKADATACPNGLCNDYSTSIFQAFSGSNLGFRAQFLPGFLGDIAKKEWTVDGEVVTEEPAGEIHFTATKPAPGIYNIGLTAQVVQPQELRRALYEIWNISPFSTSEINFSVAGQVELQEPGITQGPLQGPRKYLAAIASYIPGSVLFTFRIFLSAALVLFTLNFLYALLRERQTEAFVANLPAEKN